MKELIKIEEAVISNEKVNAVSARELHKVLEVKSRYNDWIKARLEKYDFQDGIDFCCLTREIETQTSSGRPGVSTYTDHFLTLDVAKELSMVENNPKGREARRYFIECEKKLSNSFSVKDNYLISIIKADNDTERAIALNNYERGYVRPLENKVQEQAVVIEEQTQVIEEAKPKVQFYDTVTMTTDTVDLADAAKLLNFQGVGRNTLYKLLRQWKVIDSDNRPYQKYVNIGCFKLVQYTVPGPYGNTRVKFKTVCYQKGLDLLLRMLIKKAIRSFKM